jgi:hypothetical protein
MTSLLNCAWNNYNIIYKLKYEREKIKQKNEIIRNIEMIKRRQKIEAQERNNAELLRFKSSKLYNNRKLNKFLKELGNKIYKEEELRNFNIYNKFTKTGYILSTYKMIDDLLSDDFRKILKNMKKVDVTKPEEEIQDLIDKALMKKQHQNSIKENSNTNNNININNNNSNTINYNNMNNNMNYNSNKKIINFNINNTKTSSLIMKESTTINNKNEINSFSQVKSQIASLKKRINKRSDKLIRRLIENSSRKFSTSCEVSTKNFKNTISLNSYFEHSNRKNHKLMDRTKIEDRNNFLKIYKIKSTNNSVIPKINSLTSCYRSSYSKEKVEKFNIDKDSFNKTLIKKKSFLDRYSSREFNFLAGQDFRYERDLGTFFLIVSDDSNRNFENLNYNQQILITPYDIHDTLIFIIQSKEKSIKGQSIFEQINGKKRKCNIYKVEYENEIEERCPCINF